MYGIATLLKLHQPRVRQMEFVNLLDVSTRLGSSVMIAMSVPSHSNINRVVSMECGHYQILHEQTLKY